jgi:hypothetical protein
MKIWLKIKTELYKWNDWKNLAKQTEQRHDIKFYKYQFQAYYMEVNHGPWEWELYILHMMKITSYRRPA